MLTCVACAFPVSHSLESTAKHSESDRWHPGEGLVRTNPPLGPWLDVWTKCCSGCRRRRRNPSATRNKKSSLCMVEIAAEEWNLHRGEVRIIGAPGRAEALHTLSRFSLDLLLGLGPSVVVVDVMMVDVLRGLLACHQDLGFWICTEEGPMTHRHHSTSPIWGVWTWRVPNHTWWLAARCFKDTG